MAVAVVSVLCERKLESLLSFILELRRGVVSDMIIYDSRLEMAENERRGQD